MCVTGLLGGQTMSKHVDTKARYRRPFRAMVVRSPGPSGIPHDPRVESFPQGQEMLDWLTFHSEAGDFVAIEERDSSGAWVEGVIPTEEFATLRSRGVYTA